MNLEDLRERISASPKLTRLKSEVVSELAKQGRKDPAHDYAHFDRVALWTIRFGAGQFSEDSAIAAAYLHDVINLPKNSPDRARASQMSEIKAREILPLLDFSLSEIDDIANAVRTHSFSRGEEPVSSLGRALQDADRLEALGAIGLYRVIATGVVLGTELFHPEDPWATSRELDDFKFSVDHFFKKLLKVPATMKTEAGKLEAESRTKILRDFLKALGQEIGQPCP